MNNNKIKAIVLNKPFIGDYIKQNGHDAHELINFFKADDDNLYIYNNPYGQNIRKAKDHQITHLLLTSESRKKEFRIEYCLKIEKSLHNESISKSAKEKTKQKFVENTIEQIVDNLEIDSIDKIKYANKSVIEIFKDDILVAPFTYKCNQVFKAKRPIKLKDCKDYNFQRNFGYVTENKSKNTYENLREIINDKSNWSDVTMNIVKMSVKPDNKKINCIKDITFLDLIDQHKEEESYTKIICNIINECDSRIVNKFVECLGVKTDGGEVFSHNSFNIEAEYSIKNYGRIDMITESKKQRIIIENKIESCLHLNKETSQLTNYVQYFSKKENKNNHYILLVPESRRNWIEEELMELEPDISSMWKIVGYEKIYEFMDDNKNEITRTKFKPYYNDILKLMLRQSLSRKEIAEVKLFC